MPDCSRPRRARRASSACTPSASPAALHCNTGALEVRQPMTGKNLWRLCKTYGRLIGYPQLKPHDLRQGVAMEVYEQHGDLEQVRGLLGHARIDTTQVYAQVRPARLK